MKLDTIAGFVMMALKSSFTRDETCRHREPYTKIEEKWHKMYRGERVAQPHHSAMLHPSKISYRYGRVSFVACNTAKYVRQLFCH